MARQCLASLSSLKYTTNVEDEKDVFLQWVQDAQLDTHGGAFGQ
jgi:hypothetical protein